MDDHRCVNGSLKFSPSSRRYYVGFVPKVNTSFFSRSCYDHVVITYGLRMMRKPNDQMNLSYRETYGWDANLANLNAARVG